MNASLRALLSGVVDYAGLFPPAGLPLDEAIRNYARYRQGPDVWMLGRFVIPAARLSDLDALMGVVGREPPLPLSLLGRGGDGREDYLSGLVNDIKDATDFCRRHPTGVAAEAYENRLPPHGDIPFLVHFSAELIARKRWGLFVEVPPHADAEPYVAEAVGRIAARFKQKGNQGPVAQTGLKLRTSGPEPSAIPTVERVAFVLRAYCEAGAPVKFTAGLHHPLRHFDAAVQSHAHGFINVFTAGVLAHARGLGEADLRAVLAEQDPAAFAFTDDGLRCRDWHASTPEIAAARRDFVTSFGSCSFDEPCDDLRALGWM